jgi:thiamine-phosphate pyrophosphorylase
MQMTRGSSLVGLVTDRRRLAARLGRPAGDGVPLVLSQVAAAAHAGIAFTIVREHDLEARPLLALVGGLLEIARPTGMRILVNDRLDVALAAGAHGVHLRERSFTAADARRIAPDGFLIGRSVHDERGAREAGPVDYVLAGTVFPTASKPAGLEPLGLEGLARVAAAAGVPVLAIGGIGSGEQVRQVLAAGGAGVAVIGALQPASAGSSLATEVQESAFRLRSGFDL